MAKTPGNERRPAQQIAPATSGPHAQSSIEHEELRGLVERLERALNGAPGTLSAIEAGSARIEAQQAQLNRQLAGLEQTCARADEVQRGLIEFVDRLGEVGQASQDKLSLLVEALESGQGLRQSLEEAGRRAAKQLSKFDEKGEYAARLDRIAEQAVAAITSAAEQKLADCNDAVEQALGRLSALSNECLGRVSTRSRECLTSLANTQRAAEAQMAQQAGHLVELYGPEGEQGRRLEESAQRALDLIEHGKQESRERVATIAANEAQRLQTLVKAVERRLAPFEEGGEHAVRLEKAVKEGVASVAAAAQRAASQTHEMVERELGRIVAMDKECEGRLNESARRCMASITQARQAADAEVAERMDQFDALYGTDGEQTRAIAKAAEGSLDSIAKAKEESLKHLSALTTEEASKYKVVAENTLKQLASQTQASRAAVTMVAEATADAHKVLDTLHERHEEAQGLSETLIEQTDLAKAGAARLVELTSQTEPAAARLEKSVESSLSQAAGIEALVDEAKSAAEATQQRVRQLAEATAQGDKARQQLAETAGNAETCNQQIGAAADRIADMIESAEDTIERIKTEHERANEVCASVAAATGEAQRFGDSQRSLAEELADLTGKGQNLTAELSRLVPETTHLYESTRRLRDELIARTDSAGEVSQQLNDLTAQGAQLSERVSMASTLADRLEKGNERSSALTDELESKAREAEDASRELGDLLAGIAEHRDVLEAADRIVGDFAERTEALGIKWRRLETRADSLAHQLSGMLADPARIVEDAKSHTDKLEQICKIVRKVFSGLSQSSLQANRDIERFAEISREANDKLVRISAETKRASQTLQEWVEEATHVRSRLAHTLGQVPPIEHTHPPTTLETLGKIAMESLPGTLKPGDAEPPRPPDKRERESGPAQEPEKRSGGRNINRIIREAEKLTEVRR